MSSFELPKIALTTLCCSKNAISYTMMWCFVSAIMFWKQTLMATILTGTEEERNKTTNLVAILILAIPLFQHGLCGNYISNIVANVQTDVIKNILLEYDMLTIESKETFGTDILLRKTSGIKWGVAYWIEHGFPTFFYITSSIYLSIYTFYITGMIGTLIGLVCVNAILYKYVKRHIDERQSKIWNENNKKRDKISALMNLYMAQYAYGQRELDSVMKIVADDCHIKTIFDKTRNEQRLFTSMLNECCMTIILLLSPSQYILIFITVTLQFTGTMNSIFSVMNANTQFEVDWKNLRNEFEKSKKKIETPEQYNLGYGYSIMKYSLTKPNFNLNMRSIVDIGIGKTLLVQGASGSGKTTFLKGVFGMCEDAKVTLSNDRFPNNYLASIALMYQSIKENIKIPNLTLRDLFNGSTNCELIEQVLEHACVGNWVDRLKSKVKNSTSDYLIDIDNIEQKNGDYVSIHIKYEKKSHDAWLDINLGEIGTLSGGEKTRLILAMQLYDVIVKNKSILILDEPEQGSDPPIAYKLLKNVTKFYSDKAMIVIISHLERFGGHNNSPNISGIPFTQKIFINNGNIDVTNC